MKEFSGGGSPRRGSCKLKIDTYRPNFDPDINVPRVDTRQRETKGAAGKTTNTTADAVHVSTAAQLATTAAQAASRTSDIRPDEVERAKALVASGELGRDPYRLADALIDRALAAND